MRKLLTPWRLKWYPRAVLFALTAGFFIAFFSGSGASTLTGRLGGDFPAFYSAGRIIVEGDWKNLYSAEKQASLQKSLFPGEETSFLVFVNPPFWAMLYAPLSYLDYRIAYLVHTLFMLSTLLLTVWFLSPLNEYIQKNYLLFVSIVLSFCPMLIAIGGSQNTALTFLFIVLAWRAVSANREWLAGIAFGFLLFKPQFALPLIGLHLLAGRWRILIGVIPVAAIIYTIGVYVTGPFWVADWWQYATWAAKIDAGINGNNAVCWLGFFQAISSPQNQIALFLGWGMTIITSIFLAVIWFGGCRSSDYTAQMAITASSLMLLPPHSMLYDASIILFSCFGMIGIFKERSILYLGAIWPLAYSHYLSKILGFSPLFFVTLYTFLLSVYVFLPSAIGYGTSDNFSGCFFRSLTSKYAQEKKI